MKGQANPNYSANAFKGYLMGTATRGELGTVIRGNHPTLAKLTALYGYRNVNCLFMGPMAQHPLGRTVFSHQVHLYSSKCLTGGEVFRNLTYILYQPIPTWLNFHPNFVGNTEKSDPVHLHAL